MEKGFACACPCIPEIYAMYPHFRGYFPEECATSHARERAAWQQGDEPAAVLQRWYAPWNGFDSFVEDMAERNRDKHYQPYFHGAAFMASARLFEEVGLFDLRFKPAYHEDADFAKRIGALGVSSVLAFDAYFHHWGGATSGRCNGWQEVFARNQQHMAEKTRRGYYNMAPAEPAPSSKEASPLSRGKLFDLATVSSDINEHLHFLYDLSRSIRAKTTVELGVRLGISTYALALAAQENDGVLYSVDVHDYSGIWQLTHGLVETPSCWKFVQANDMELAKEWSAMIDMLFVDTSHTYEHTVAELREWAPFVRPGGIIALHDTMSSRDGVFRAIREFLGKDTRWWETFADSPEFFFLNRDNCNGLGVLWRK